METTGRFSVPVCDGLLIRAVGILVRYGRSQVIDAVREKIRKGSQVIEPVDPAPRPFPKGCDQEDAAAFVLAAGTLREPSLSPEVPPGTPVGPAGPTPCAPQG